MEYSPTESKNGLYDIYYSETGERFVVLEGLSIEDAPVEYPIQVFMQTHYETISFMYWILYGAALTFLVTKFLAVPLYQKWKQHKNGDVQHV